MNVFVSSFEHKTFQFSVCPYIIIRFFLILTPNPEYEDQIMIYIYIINNKMG